jgi:hypothetical protein
LTTSQLFDNLIKTKNKNMPKKIKTESDIMLKKIKSTFVEVIMREWLNAPAKEWGNKSPLQLIKAGEGQIILDALRAVDASLSATSNKKDVVNNIVKPD